MRIIPAGALDGNRPAPGGHAAGMEFVLPLVVFLAIYFFLWRRAGRPPVQWGWLALIIGLTAAVLLHSLARNHPLVDGNKRLAWLATYVLLAKNDVILDPDDDEAYDLVVAVAAGEVDDVTEIARHLDRWIA